MQEHISVGCFADFVYMYIYSVDPGVYSLKNDRFVCIYMSDEIYLIQKIAVSDFSTIFFIFL